MAKFRTLGNIDRINRKRSLMEDRSLVRRITRDEDLGLIHETFFGRDAWDKIELIVDEARERILKEARSISCGCRAS